MGIANLWQNLPSEERVSFPVFVTRFLQKRKRPPRFAIDAYMFMFWSSFTNGESDDPTKESYDIRNFMAKLWYMVRMNVSVVVVFDGSHKSDKLRHGKIPGFPGSESYDEVLDFFLSSPISKYTENSRVIEKLKNVLTLNRMDWVQAPAEAEAECAWLQRLGVVDYVISDDSDTLVFGAEGVLRWFNRIKNFGDKEDPATSSTDYYVTPAHMSRITKETNLTRNRLVMMAVLRGGDYSKGAEDIGIVRAKEIALCGTTMLVKLPNKAPQDYGEFCDITSKFVNTFLESDSLVPSDPYFGRKAECDRHECLLAFNEFLNEYLQENGTKIFGRATKIEKKISIDDYNAMLYFFPLVNSKIFKFTPHSTTFGEPSHVIEDLITPEFDCEVLRINNLISPRVIGRSIIKKGAVSFQQCRGECVDLNITKIPLPRERKYNLKAFALKFLKDKSLWQFIKFARIKEFETISLVVLKFDRVKLNDFVYHTRKDVLLHADAGEELRSEQATTEDEVEDQPEAQEGNNKLIEVPVPLECVNYVSPEFVESFKNTPQRKSPQKKKNPPQKTTLDLFFKASSPIIQQEDYFDRSSISPTPQKKGTTDSRNTVNKLAFNVNLEHNQAPDSIIDLENSQSNLRAAKKKTSPTVNTPAKNSYRRKKSNKAELSPGQTTITPFILLRRGGESEMNPVMVDSGEKTDEDDTFYQKMKDELGFGPILNKSNAAEERPLSSPESSPTKRHRRDMYFSPDNSPVKARPETKAPW